MASRTSRLALTGASLFAITTIIFVHFQQRAEKAAMHQGVVRDVERQRLKKEQRDRQLDFELQRQLEAEYRQEQTVRSTTADADEGR